MCGRFTQRYTWSEVHAFLGVIGAAKNLRPRYNIAPTTTIDVVRLAEGGRGGEHHPRAPAEAAQTGAGQGHRADVRG